jgi:glucokinase
MPVIGVDLGGTKLALAVFSEEGRILHRQAMLLDGRKGAEVGGLITEQALALREAWAREATPVRGLGVAVPGIYRSGPGTVWAPNIPGWEDYPLRDEIRSALGSDLPVRIDSDRACCILGETWQGTARGSRNAIFLTVGTGIGAGILAGGRVLRGHGDAAGAIGWLALQRPYRPEYAPVGCFEYHASGPGLVSAVRETLAGEITTADVFAAAESGDPVARSALDDAVAFWGMAVANLVSLFNPERIVLGGGVFGPAARFLERIREEAQRWAQPVSIRQVTISVTSLGADAGLYGAGWLALEAAGAEG